MWVVVRALSYFTFGMQCGLWCGPYLILLLVCSVGCGGLIVVQLSSTWAPYSGGWFYINCALLRNIHILI